MNTFFSQFWVPYSIQEVRQVPKLRIKINKPKKPGLSSFLQIRRRHSLASSDSPIDLFGLLPKDVNGGLSTEPTLAKVSHKLATNGNSR